MNREIKFRAWDKRQKKMVKVTGLMLPMNSEINIATYMQFTGLLDKNGKEIYEGDICKIDTKELSGEFCDNLLSHTGKIDWVQNGCEYWLSLFFPKNLNYSSGDEFIKITESEWGEDQLESKYLIIIGNIYENKDLI